MRGLAVRLVRLRSGGDDDLHRRNVILARIWVVFRERNVKRKRGHAFRGLDAVNEDIIDGLEVVWLALARPAYVQPEFVRPDGDGGGRNLVREVARCVHGYAGQLRCVRLGSCDKAVGHFVKILLFKIAFKVVAVGLHRSAVKQLGFPLVQVVSQRSVEVGVGRPCEGYEFFGCAASGGEAGDLPCEVGVDIYIVLLYINAFIPVNRHGLYSEPIVFYNVILFKVSVNFILIGVVLFVRKSEGVECTCCHFFREDSVCASTVARDFNYVFMRQECRIERVGGFPFKAYPLSVCNCHEIGWRKRRNGDG